jgi:hypothetical protein
MYDVGEVFIMNIRLNSRRGIGISLERRTGPGPRRRRDLARTTASSGFHLRRNDNFRIASRSRRKAVSRAGGVALSLYAIEFER